MSAVRDESDFVRFEFPYCRFAILGWQMHYPSNKIELFWSFLTGLIVHSHENFSTPVAQAAEPVKSVILYLD